MSDAVIVSLIGGCFSVIAACAAIVAARLDHHNKRAIEQVHILVNGRLCDALAKIQELEERLKSG